MAVFRVEQSGRWSATKVDVDTWLEVIREVHSFIDASTLDPIKRAELFFAVMETAGDVAVELPNGKKLEIIDIFEGA